jgi:hypothetical protein
MNEERKRQHAKQRVSVWLNFFETYKKTDLQQKIDALEHDKKTKLEAYRKHYDAQLGRDTSHG